MDEFNWYSIEPIVSKIDQQIRREVENRLEYALRHLVTPPIKGDITRGKIRWRGISLTQIIINNGDVFSTDIAQDGTLIEPTFIGRTITIQFSWKANLTQRGKEIPLTFGEEGEDKYIKLLIENNKL